MQDTELDVKYVKDAAEIIVADDTDLNEIESLLLSIGGVFEGEHGALGIYQIGFPGVRDPETLDELIAQLRNSPFIEGAGRVVLIDSRQFILPEFTSDWNEKSPIIGHPAQALMYAKFLSAWALAYEYINPENATKVNIGIIDQGFDKSHVDLLPNISKLSSIVPLSIGDHGTGVAGVVGAVPNVAIDGLKTVGALWNADLILMDLGLFNTHLNVVDKMSKSINAGAKVINYSGGKTYPEHSLWMRNSEANARAMYRRLFGSCFSKGLCASDVLFLFSVGNDNDEGTGISEDFVNDVPSSFSLEYPNVISVGAIRMGPDSQRDGQGGNIDVAAPSSVWTTISGNKWGNVFGTSYAAPMVAGLVGLILTRNPDLTSSQIKNIIKAGSCINPHPRRGKVVGENYYVINAEESLKLADNPDAAINACKDKSTATGKLNDTGITTCSNNSQNGLQCPVSGFPGQDGEHGRDALAAAGLLQKVGGGSAGFDFTKLDADGNPLVASATEWSCVKDNHTGLIWEEKATSGLRSMHHTYTWYNPDSSTNGGHPGTQNGGNCSGSSCDTHGYVQAVNAQGLCGANDWRMPAKEELRSIVDLNYSRVDPAIDTDYFPHTPSNWFWVASTYAEIVSYAWDLNFYGGNDFTTAKSSFRYVRLVRGGQ